MNLVFNYCTKNKWFTLDRKLLFQNLSKTVCTNIKMETKTEPHQNNQIEGNFESTRG